jgi:hypothetical protein
MVAETEWAFAALVHVICRTFIPLGRARFSRPKNSLLEQPLHPCGLNKRRLVMADNTGTSNPEYNLISVLYHALQGADLYQKYASDAGSD